MKKTLFKNIAEEIRLIASRSQIAIGIIIVCFILLFARLFYLTVLEHDYYRNLSIEHHTRRLTVEAERGQLLDRNGVVLASNKSVFSLDVIPEKTTNLSQELTTLNAIVPYTPHMLAQFQRALKKASKSSEIPLKLTLTEEERARFAVNQYRFPGFIIRARLLRTYPLGSSTAHVVGYVGRNDTESNAEAPFVGKDGIEKTEEARLQGQPGTRLVEVNAAGRTLHTLSVTASTPGESLTLTIDSRLQRAAQKAFGDVRGALVAIDPQNGQVLALYSNPSFDPSWFVDGMADAQYASLSKNRALVNRALQGRYPPASTVKPFVALAGLNAHVITKDTVIDDPGYFILPNSTHRFHDWVPHGHGRVDLTKAITVSCDTYFYSLSHDLGIMNLASLLHEFGFGELTHIALPNEQIGLLPTPEWKRSHRGSSWYPGDTLITGIGQGSMLVTPMQLANSVATLAMHGVHYTPHLLLNEPPSPLPLVVLKNANDWQTVISAMQAVINSKEGTGFRFGRNAPYSVAGKTGTAQVISMTQQHGFSHGVPKDLQNNSLFIAFAPVEHPRIALAVITEHSPIAPVIARAVMDQYLGASS